MRWNCDAWRERRKARLQEKIDRLTVWHRWFAWRPRRVSYGDCRWLEFMERKYTLVKCYRDPDYWRVEYRAIR
jgi:hypothetical protein